MITASKEQQEWTTAYLGLGANLGDRAANLLDALRKLDALPTITLTAVSSLYETAPVGLTDQPPFLNAAAAIQTTLTPEGLLRAILHLENQMGRARTQRWGPRVIDIDILAYGARRIDTPALCIPHPRLWERAFVLVPLAEIAPTLTLPGYSQAIKKRAEQLRESENILASRVVNEFWQAPPAPGTP